MNQIEKPTKPSPAFHLKDKVEFYQNALGVTRSQICF